MASACVQSLSRRLHSYCAFPSASCQTFAPTRMVSLFSEAVLIPELSEPGLEYVASFNKWHSGLRRMVQSIAFGLWRRQDSFEEMAGGSRV